MIGYSSSLSKKKTSILLLHFEGRATVSLPIAFCFNVYAWQVAMKQCGAALILAFETFATL